MDDTTTRTVWGTCYFPTRDAAVRYYKPQVKIEYPHGGWFKATCELVNQKIYDGEIVIGKPEAKPGQGLFVRDNRWHVEEVAS